MKFYFGKSSFPHLQAMMSYEYDCAAHGVDAGSLCEWMEILWFDLETSGEIESSIDLNDLRCERRIGILLEQYWFFGITFQGKWEEHILKIYKYCAESKRS